jgi:hypothetical protein
MRGFHARQDPLFSAIRSMWQLAGCRQTRAWHQLGVKRSGTSGVVTDRAGVHSRLPSADTGCAYVCRSSQLCVRSFLHVYLALAASMASRAAAAAAKAIYAEPAFIPKGPINSGRFNLIREIVIGTTLGIAGGLVWKVSVPRHRAPTASLQPLTTALWPADVALGGEAPHCFLLH